MKTALQYREDQKRDDRGRFADEGGWAPGEKETYREQQLRLDMHAAVSDYTNTGHEEVNGYLRHDMWSGEARERAKEGVKLMDAAFRRAEPLKAPMVVYRVGLLPRSVYGKDGPKVGATFRDKGFVSTTKAQMVAEKARGYDTIVMEITVPRGARVLDVNRDFASYQPREREVILPRGTKFRVVRSSGIGDISLRMLPS